VILTLDLGTTVTKVGLWGTEGLVALAGTTLTTDHPAPGWSEQDPSAWWASVVDACGRVRSLAPDGFAAVEVVGCTGARQTFAPVDGSGVPVGPGVLWSDRRATVEAQELAVDAGAVAAKIAWMSAHQPDRLEAASWLLAPRDLVVLRLTGVVATDPTMASRSGLYDPEGRVVSALAGPAASLLAPVVPSDRVTGAVTASSAAELGLTPGTPVVIGAGDRACEVLGSGATERCPMVSWGTTANVSLPVSSHPDPPTGVVVSRSTDGGWLVEGGLSAAGSMVAWLGGLTSRVPEELAELARRSPPGSRGVVATPWLDGARAPWWRHDAGAAFVGLSSAHDVADLSRAVFEGVAWEVARCLGLIAARRPAGPPVEELTLAGAGASTPVWPEVLTGITGLPARRRRSGQAASAGAALLSAAAAGIECTLDGIDAADARTVPDPAVVARYAELKDRAQRVAAAVVALDGGPCA
jgi:xylulokinase